MKNMDKGLTVPRWVLIVQLKIPQMPQIYLPNFLPKPKVWDFNEKRFHWASLIRVRDHNCAKKASF